MGLGVSASGFAGGMLLHLHRARLFGVRNAECGMKKRRSPQADLAAARSLIEKHGYWRRKEELEDAEKALLA